MNSHRTASALLADLSTRQVSAAEAVETVLQSIAADEGRINSVIRLAPHAREQARQVDRRRAAGETLPPLAGLPVTVKDSFDVEGMVSGHGIAADEFVALADAPSVAALRAAGAIVVGKTNVPTLLADYQSMSPDFGHTRNPWDLTRTSGGSSSGAAAVAAGQSYLDLGSDMSGSVRVPAAWCGTFALRPSHGLISKRGHLPWPSTMRIEPPASTVGLMARAAADLLLPFDALVAGAPAGGAMRRPPASDESVSTSMTVGVWLPDDWPRTGSDVRAAIERWCGLFTDAGYDLRLLTPSRGGRAEAALYRQLTDAEIAHGSGNRRAAPPLLHALEEQADIAAAWAAEVFTQVHAVICPVAPIVAPPLSDVESSRRLIHLDGELVPSSVVLDWCIVSSVARCPAVVLPLGPDPATGMPVGVQIVTAHGHDREAVALACELEESGLTTFAAPPVSGSTGVPEATVAP